MTLIEISLSMVVLAVAVSTTLGAITSFAGLEESNKHKIEAYLAARRTVETMQASQFGDTFSLYDESAANDPVGVNIPGAGFDVPGLDPIAGDADGLVGRVLFPVTAGGLLIENQIDASFGGPRDLNADGLIDGADRSDDYVVLPARVRVEWSSRSGDRFVEIQTLLSPR